MSLDVKSLARRCFLVITVAFGSAAVIVCSVGPMRPQSESAATNCGDPNWTTRRNSWSKHKFSSSSSPRFGNNSSSVSEGFVTAPDGDDYRGKIIEDPNGYALNAFYESLVIVENADGPGPMSRVSCFGDSHTAADFMTGQLRRRMQSRFGDGGHGFIAAGRPWPSYRHRNIQSGAQGSWEALRIRHRTRAEDSDGRLGLGGVAIETDRSKARAWVSTVEDGPFGRTASLFELYYLSHPRGGRLGFYVDDQEVARFSSRAPEVHASYYRVQVEEGPHRFDVETLGHGLVRLFGIVVETEGPGVTVDSLGINGARITAVLGWDEDIFSDNLAHRGPDLVVLWYGANSVGDDWYSVEQYQQWVIDALARIRRAVPDASCLLVGPPDMSRSSLVAEGPAGTPRALRGLIAAQRDAAGLVGCGFFDTFRAMGGENSSLSWAEREPSLISGDGIHFTALGYETIADLLYDALMDGYEQYLEVNPQ